MPSSILYPVISISILFGCGFAALWCRGPKGIAHGGFQGLMGVGLAGRWAKWPLVTARPATRGTNMAKLINGKLSGQFGGVVYVNTRRGQVVRSRPSRGAPRRPEPAPTPLWPASRAIGAYARKNKRPPGQAAGKKVNLSGFHHFCQINYRRAAASEPLLMDPPNPSKASSRRSHTTDTVAHTVAALWYRRSSRLIRGSFEALFRLPHPFSRPVPGRQPSATMRP